MDPEKLAEAIDAQDQVARLIIADLSKPFLDTEIKYRKAGNSDKQLAYLETMTVVKRLNEVAPRWDSVVVDQTAQDFGMTSRGSKRLLLRATVSLTIPEVGTRTHTGVQVVNAEDGGEDLWKGAISDALKKAASLFGVGAYLYFDPEPDQINTMPQPVAPMQPQARPSTQPAPAQPQGSGGITQSQYDLLMRLAYERGYAASDYENAPSLSKQDASSIIDNLMKEPRVNQLERGQRPPDEWFGITY